MTVGRLGSNHSIQQTRSAKGGSPSGDLGNMGTKLSNREKDLMGTIDVPKMSVSQLLNPDLSGDKNKVGSDQKSATGADSASSKVKENPQGSNKATTREKPLSRMEIKKKLAEELKQMDEMTSKFNLEENDSNSQGVDITSTQPVVENPQGADRQLTFNERMKVAGEMNKTKLEGDLAKLNKQKEKRNSKLKKHVKKLNSMMDENNKFLSTNIAYDGKAKNLIIDLKEFMSEINKKFKDKNGVKESYFLPSHMQIKFLSNLNEKMPEIEKSMNDNMGMRKTENDKEDFRNLKNSLVKRINDLEKSDSFNSSILDMSIKRTSEKIGDYS
ncbi:MAG: hypothetical protein ACON35_02150 [Candidatus Marinamargulisbacteria bacterium]